MHTKAKSRLTVILILISFLVISIVSITAIFALTQQNTKTRVDIQYFEDVVPLEAMTFKLSDDSKSYSFSGCEASVEGTLAIPETYKGSSITSIDLDSLFMCDKIETLIIPKSVTSIDNNSGIASCENLTQIVVDNNNPRYQSKGNCIIETSSKTLIAGCKNSIIPTDGSVEVIGENAFHFCDELTKISIPNTITKIDKSAFNQCKRLSELTIPKSVNTIEDRAFFGCEALNKIEVESANSKYYSEGAGDCIIEKESGNLIQGCKDSKIPTDGKVKSIGNRAFGRIPLTTLTLPNTITSIEDGAFYMSGLSTITLPNSLISIGENSFQGCNLKNIEIPNNVKDIGYNAFKGCQFTTITVPSSATNIDGGAFAYCNNLSEIQVESGNLRYYSEGDCIIETQTGKLIQGCKDSEIPTDGSIITIGQNSFAGCTELTSIIIPNSVLNIENDAFWDCSALSSVIFENPNNWNVYDSPDPASGAINSSYLDLSNPSTAARFLSLAYSGRYWNRAQ